MYQRGVAHYHPMLRATLAALFGLLFYYYCSNSSSCPRVSLPPRVRAAPPVRRVGMRGLVLLVLHLGSCHARKRHQIVEEDGSVGWTRAKKAEIEKATAAEAHERHRREKAGLAPLPLWPTHATTCSGRPCRPGEGNMKGYQMWSQVSSHPPQPEPEPEPKPEPEPEPEPSLGPRSLTLTSHARTVQPYEHREAFVQSRTRRMPHRPDADTYAELVCHTGLEPQNSGTQAGLLLTS